MNRILDFEFPGVRRLFGGFTTLVVILSQPGFAIAEALPSAKLMVGSGDLRPELFQSFKRIHKFAFELYQVGGIANLELCQKSTELFDFSTWLALPPGTPAREVCGLKGYREMIGQLVDTLVVKPRALIERNAGSLLTTSDTMVVTFMGDSYLSLKSYLQSMLAQPLDFALVGEPQTLGKFGDRVRLDAPVQLAQGLINKLEELKIEPKAAAAIREFGRAHYIVNRAANGDIRLEGINLPEQRLAAP